MIRVVNRITIAMLIAACAMPACSGARALVPNEHDAYRDQIRALESQLALTAAENRELRATLSATAAVNTAGISPEVLQNVPQAARLVVELGSLIERTADDPDKATVSLHISPRDSRDRFVPITGWLEVTIASLPGYGAVPKLIGGLSFAPGELREALRSGLFGNHYTAICVIDLSEAKGSLSAVVNVTFRDGFSGRELSEPFAFRLEVADPVP
ncbi:MAG: hypothetical protein SGJ11_01485 [Phycisphaerae bacterium]|nr:hypothetical protein [Phycisphaerae bacterium]